MNESVPEGETSPGMPPVDSTALRNAWLRETQPKGIHLPKFFLGEILFDIDGDDGDFFRWGNQDVYLADPEVFRRNANVVREEYIVRLDREISTCLPFSSNKRVEGRVEDIKVELGKMQESIRSADWTDREQFLSAWDQWRLLSEQVREIRKENPELQEAFDYYWRKADDVDKLYQTSLERSEE
ncbi:MAG: hypothetical protein PHV63_01390 [Candidatus Daviesbacteria bacterium]|nr:hypothetical protein [Candidatus Daviesbacteria bacterium]